MNIWKPTALAATLVLLSGTTAMAGCDITSGRVSIIGNEFPAIQTVAKAAEACAGPGVEVKANLTADHEKLNLAGMQGNPAEYTVAIVASSSIVTLLNEGVIRPLDDLVAKFGQNLQPNQLITVDGKVMAVAFLANAQHLVYRKDVLEKIGQPVPKSYEDVLADAQMIRDQGIMPYPIGGTYKAGWNLATEFVNMYNGEGGEFFKPGSAEVAVNNAQGVKALEVLKALTTYMNPDYLTYDSNALTAEWEAGNVALMNIWGSRLPALKDAEGSTTEIVDNTEVASAPVVSGGTTPATALWWDGWTVAKNISDEDAEASFKAMIAATSPAILNDETTGQGVWLIEGYKPNDLSAGVLASVNSGAKPYPMLPYMGLLQTALGDNLADYLQGNEDAAKTLADTEAAYTAAAKEKGYLK